MKNLKQGSHRNDVVMTPKPLAKMIVEHFNPTGRILEPCKGEGNFLEYLPSAEWCEISEGKDFFNFSDKVDWIVTNPPYSDFNRFLEHSFALAENIVLLVPVAKMFKSMGTLKAILDYGGFVSIHTLPASKAGFPFGFPCAVYYLKRGYKGQTKIEMLNCAVS